MKLDKSFSREISKIANGDGGRDMTYQEKAELILDEIDANGPINVDWNNRLEWIEALVGALVRIDKEEK